MCRATPAEHAAPLLAVVANYAWWRGDGARAGMAVDIALDLEPDHRLARLIRQALDLGARGDGAWSGLDRQRSAPAGRVRVVERPIECMSGVAYGGWQVMSVSDKPRLAGRQPSYAVGCPG